MNNLFCFHGIDHKVGVTMTAQSVAELIASANDNINVLLISLNGRKSCEYVREEVRNIDDYKLQIDSKMLLSKEFIRDCKYKSNLYFLAGLENEHEERYYFPDSAKYLLESIEGDFDIIIGDTGSELDNGLALGGMAVAKKNYLITTQLESNLDRYTKRAPWFEKAEINFESIIINKFCEEDPSTLKYVTERMYFDRNKAFKIKATGYEHQAELERKTFMEFKSETYRDEITLIANNMLELLEIPQIKHKRKGKIWKSFI